MLSLLAGCAANPLFPHGSDYAPGGLRERLRAAEPMRLEDHRASEQADADGAGVPRSRFEGAERVELTLEACRAAALERNLNLRVALLEPAIANASVSEEEGRFNAVFTTRALWSDTDSPTASDLDSAQREFGLLEPGVTIPLRTGGTASVGLPMTRTETNNIFSTLNPAYTSDLELSISHNLLRGAGRRANTHGIRIASYGRQTAEARTKAEVIRQLAAVDRAYWRLYRARGELDVRQQQYELAVRQLERARRRFGAGLAPEIEVIRAEAGVAERLEAIIVAENASLALQRELKRLVNLPDLGPESAAQVLPASPPDPVRYEFDPGALASAAVANRMEMLELELQLAMDALNVEFNRNQALPLIVLDYTYRINGLGDDAGSSFRTLRDNRFEDWQLGLRAEVPLGNEERESRVRRSMIQRLQRLGTRDAREQAIRSETLGFEVAETIDGLETLDAIDAIEAGWQRVLASRQAAILAARTFAAEERQFGVGASTTNDVLDAAARLADAQSAELRAIVDYQIAQVDLAFATGTLLGANRVSFEPADPLGRIERRERRWGE
ncbi:MAG TPA: TolC family protein [Phycisphaerales bacterium]|nr:TolC family protein [Phycisphaerales bacterium]